MNANEDFFEAEQCVSQFPVPNLPASQSTVQQSSPGAIARPAASPLDRLFGDPAVYPEKKRKLIQLRRELFVLWHAQRCPSEGQCPGLPECQPIKQVLSHMTSCSAGETCPVPRCSSSRQLISHWNDCTWSDCPACGPWKKALLRRDEYYMMKDLEHMKICN